MPIISTVAAVAAILILYVVLIAWRLNIRREMGREGPDDSRSDRAYDRVSRWILFDVIRWLVMRRLRKLQPHGTVLDAGCGPGYLVLLLARRLPELNIVGIDVSPDMLRLAGENADSGRSRRQPGFIAADVTRLPLATASADLIVSTLSLHHWLQPDLALGEFYRVLKPGGQMLIFDLRRDMPRSLFGIFRIGQRLLAPAEIRRINGAVGSVWASLAPAEMETLVAKSPFANWKVLRGWGWAWIWGRKTDIAAVQPLALNGNTSRQA